MNTQQITKPDEREQILSALAAWIAQRPGLEYGNYGDPKSYRAELRSITKDLHHARALLRFVELRQSITADMLKEGFRRGFSGRLSWVPAHAWQCDKCGCVSGRAQGLTSAPLCCNAPMRQLSKLEYCTGQYWPTEYRRAVCAVLASAIWYWWREKCMPLGFTEHPADPPRYDGLSAGDYLRRNARREFGRAIASRWFN